MTQTQPPIHLKNSIATQIIRVVFSIYLVVTVTVTSVHMLSEYRNTRSHLFQDLVFFQQTYEPVFKDILRDQEKNAPDNPLRDLVRNPILSGITIVDSKSQKIILSAGEYKKQDKGLFFTDWISHKSYLDFQDSSGRYWSVEITVYSSESILADRISTAYSFILVNALIKTLTLWLIYLWVSRLLLGKPLSILISAARSINLGNLEHFKLIVETSKKNELKILEETLSDMVKKLLKERRKMEKGMEDLKNLGEEGRRISGSRSFPELIKQVKKSFNRVGRKGIEVDLLFPPDPEGKTASPIIESPSSKQKIFSLTDPKDESVSLGQLSVTQLAEEGRMEEIAPIYRPLLVNISNTIKGISLFNKLQSYAKSLEEKNKELERTDKLKDEFIANTSHELRTPLNGIIGISESMLEGAAGELNEAQRYHLQLMVKSGRSLSRLINDLLDFSKMKTKNLVLEKRQVHLPAEVEVVISFSTQSAEQKGLQLLNHVPKTIAQVFADDKRLQQILFNLVGNAIKFTEKGRVVVGAEELPSGMVKIFVSDTGVGIPDSQKEKIFLPFEQLDGSISKIHGGMGLGLSISKKLVEMQNGILTVESIEGKGSIFSFTLPLASSPGSLEEVQKEVEREYSNSPLPGEILPPQNIESESNFSSMSAKTVLVIDDEIVNIQILKNFLQVRGYRVLSALDGFQALEILEGESPDLILLDLMMPRMSGFEVCLKIRESHSFTDMPILMLTAKSQVEDLVLGFKSGANDYMMKPFFKEELMARVENLLQAKNAVENLRELKRLKTEISKRKKAQENTLFAKRRLVRILDLADEAIIAANDEKKIIFLNRHAESLLLYFGQDLVGKELEMIFPEENLETLMTDFFSTTEKEQGKRRVKKLSAQTKTGKNFEVDVFISQIEQEKERSFAFIFKQSEKPSLSGNFLQGNLPKVEALNGALSEVAEDLTAREGEIVQDIRTFDPSLDNLPEVLPERILLPEFRKAIVEVLSLSLQYWETTTKKTRVELAETTKLWSVFVDKGTFRTRTLDKYLFVNTLPKRPRWKNVIATAKYVLTNCPNQEPLKSYLQSAIYRLQRLFPLKTKDEE